jgi:phosphoglycolate phosphatase-like HAD superfamily hydrolase
VQTALDRVGGGTAVMIGDAVWDVEAARRAGLEAIGLRCGGFGEAELRDAGALTVFDSPLDLVEKFETSGLPAQAR